MQINMKQANIAQKAPIMYMSQCYHCYNLFCKTLEYCLLSHAINLYQQNVRQQMLKSNHAYLSDLLISEFYCFISNLGAHLPLHFYFYFSHGLVPDQLQVQSSVFQRILLIKNTLLSTLLRVLTTHLLLTIFWFY